VLKLVESTEYSRATRVVYPQAYTISPAMVEIGEM